MESLISSTPCHVITYILKVTAAPHRGVNKVTKTLVNGAPIKQCIDFNQRTSMEKPLVMTAMVGDSGSVLLKTAVGFLQFKGKELTVRPKKNKHAQY